MLTAKAQKNRIVGGVDVTRLKYCNTPSKPAIRLMMQAVGCIYFIGVVFVLYLYSGRNFPNGIFLQYKILYNIHVSFTLTFRPEYSV